MLAEKLLGYRVQVIRWYKNVASEVTDDKGEGLRGKIVALAAYPKASTDTAGVFKAVVLLDNGRLHTAPTDWLKVF